MAARKRYDWDAYTDGEYRVVLAGVGTRARLSSLRSQLCKEARERGLYARTRIFRASVDSWFSADRDSIVFRFVADPDDDIVLEDALPVLREQVRPHFVEQFPQLFGAS